MKILFSSYHNPHFLTVTEYVENAILELGHELVRFDARKYIIPGRLREALALLEWSDLQRINLKFKHLVQTERPDLCLVMGGHRISAASIEQCKKKGIPVVLWTTDVPLVFDKIRKAAPFYDHIFCAGSEAVEILKSDGLKQIDLLPFAYDEHLHHRLIVAPDEEDEYKKDIVFVGSYYPNRAAILSGLTDYSLGIWGPGWHQLPESSALKPYTVTRQITHQEWMKIFSSAKICLVIHYQDGKTPSYQISPKLFEALACKGFVLVDKQKDALTLFKSGKHVVYFDNPDDLKEKIDFYLKHPERRGAIAKEGQHYNAQTHTYKHRIETLLNTLKNRNLIKDV